MDPRLLAPFAGRFRRLRRLGEGAQGVVWLCRDLRSPRRHLAVKLVRSSGAPQTQLEREARALRGLRGCPAAPELRALLYRHGRLRGFATAYLAGQTLDVFLGPAAGTKPATPSLPPLTVRRLAVALGRAVVDVLRSGWIHRDLKPQNVLITPDEHVRLLDFGLACHRLDPQAGRDLSGTLTYASPEQLEQQALDARSDLFALGVILHELATGRSLFSDGGRTTSFRSLLALRSHRLTAPLDLDGVPQELAALIARLLVVDRRQRADIPEVEARLASLARPHRRASA